MDAPIRDLDLDTGRDRDRVDEGPEQDRDRAVVRRDIEMEDDRRE
jgi:hypothetical protein